jgi:hypothetical protein
VDESRYVQISHFLKGFFFKKNKINKNNYMKKEKITIRKEKNENKNTIKREDKTKIHIKQN